VSSIRDGWASLPTRFIEIKIKAEGAGKKGETSQVLDALRGELEKRKVLGSKRPGGRGLFKAFQEAISPDLTDAQVLALPDAKLAEACVQAFLRNAMKAAPTIQSTPPPEKVFHTVHIKVPPPPLDYNTSACQKMLRFLG